MSLKDEYIKKSKADNLIISPTPPFPLKLKIDVCSLCNYSCVFCPTAVIAPEKGLINEKLCINIIKDAYLAGAKELAISGIGEPLLNQKLETYIKLAKDLGYEYVFINTNGFLLDEKRAESLLESGIDSIKVSFNAGTRKTYQLIHGIDGYDRVISNIKTFFSLKKSCKLYLSFVTIKQNKHEIPEIVSALKDYTDDILIINANSRGGGDIDKRLLLGSDDFTFEYPCGQLFKTAVTTCEGYLVICCQDFDKLTVVADLNETNIKDAWNSDAFIQFRKKHINKYFDDTICNNCLFGAVEKPTPLNQAMAYYSKSQEKSDYLLHRIEKLLNTELDKEE
jgi:MoaA/NifB/PqqE/SkfB family radical SAM enzyme